MQDYLVVHTFKSEELRQKHFTAVDEMSQGEIAAGMNNENASLQRNWNNGENDMAMFCWWKAKSPDAILETLGDMSDSFENDIREMPNIMDMSDR